MKISDHLGEKSLLDNTEEAGYLKDVLVDADALVALAKTNDSNHKRAIRLSEKLQKAGVSFYFSPFTVAEATTVLSYKTSQPDAKKFLKQIRSLQIPVLELPEKFSSLADEWFLKQKQKGTSYFDCYNMALLDRYKKQLVAIFSFDVIYKKNGFTLVAEMV
ncbi:MAG: hypothetical protein UX85_C0001G0200 [Candidatus Beckwithbacteria bacterium GW2011_GWB1_47_15]|uniref:PIN domain-containing protein n=1 Tax=Candidatus Beckwithbacteria bacterium GW2011_GWB1_47_15 TaxID=1618371 RepID=A0A0G1RXZ8_9BACT|nr:MAG: PIN domain-like protein [Candidatus Beckwithbacteria bacterium GW2011_GWC1_49_16]AQS30837.1 hypothetical protein [uncultured bacterium]KKU36022.1 MAG: hypothetical protein UX50_C0001G0199 [Candidatus Beckwithbacteria bacterium GW2011_GWA1_46_30]KKU61986.1 MAG: hypothetical protein UX85_C0001G0200 [Candidatus Beckwithbacteria bacterium GW2011_GWB1_47_15]KKU72460.1 MAG: hypothetical protein UX97_C0001G0330 [Candidatus Beckwithbacteria bacterium GW2011_GWA2_47_25]KKW04373.1 MAG: hypotheti